MVRRYENLVDSDTRVDVNTGIVAAGRPQSLIDSRQCSRDLLVMKVRWTRSVTRSSSHCRRRCGWRSSFEKLEELEQHPEALDVGADSFNDADDEPFDPTEFDEDDEF